MSNILSAASKNKYQVKGLNLENFLFKLTSAGVGMQHVKRHKHTLKFTSSTANHKLISGVAEELGLEIKVTAQIGLISLAYKLPYCIGGFLGILLSAYFVFYMTRFITKVEIDVPQNHVCANGTNCIYKEASQKELKDYLNSNGLKEGKTITTNVKGLQNSVVAHFRLVENCSIVKTGSIVHISLSEAVGNNETENYTKIVADTNCIIYSINTFSGKALVKAGDMVVSGQTLVEADGDALPRADITARVWHYGTEIFDQNQLVAVRTGKSKKTTSLSIFGKTIYGASKPKYQLYEATENISYTSPNNFLPIVKTTTTYWEVTMQTKFIEFSSVKDKVYKQAYNQAFNKVPVGATMQDCHYSELVEDTLVRVDCYITCLQSVGINK